MINFRFFVYGKFVISFIKNKGYLRIIKTFYDMQNNCLKSLNKFRRSGFVRVMFAN